MHPDPFLFPDAYHEYSVCIASIMRVVSYKGVQLNDMTYAGVDSMTWSIVEQSMGIVCACLAIIRPLVWRSRINIRRDKARDSWSSCGMRVLTSVNLGTFEDAIAGDRSSCNSTSDSDSTVTLAELEDGQNIATPAEIPQLGDATIGIALTTAPDEGKRKRFAVLSAIEEETRIEECIDPMSEELQRTSLCNSHGTAF